MLSELNRKLGVKSLPCDMCDSGVCGAMAPEVKLACKQFPEKAMGIVKAHGFENDEFQELNNKFERDSMYRSRVSIELDSLDRRQKKIISLLAASKSEK